MKKKVILFFVMYFVCIFSLSTQTKYSVQVVMPELENISGSEKKWLGGQIRDKLKSNLQEYLGMETFVDAKSEAALVKIQKESENSARDEKTAIELGKITTAKYALFSTIRKTNTGFVITVDFTDLKTGKQEASASSKEYSAVENLYGTAGAVDEITLLLATKLNIVSNGIREVSNITNDKQNSSAKMIAIPQKKFEIMSTEVTQKLYQSIMGENPSYFNGDDLPVECVSWYDAIYFCNKLSEKHGYTPVYAVNGQTAVSLWKYIPHKCSSIVGTITQNTNANGFRLPSNIEWEYAAYGGQKFTYAGSISVEEIAWYDSNSGGKTQVVALKKPNAYGLFDMSGNVREWVWDSDGSSNRCTRGGSWFGSSYNCKILIKHNYEANQQRNDIGFRVVRTIR